MGAFTGAWSLEWSRTPVLWWSTLLTAPRQDIHSAWCTPRSTSSFFKAKLSIKLKVIHPQIFPWNSWAGGWSTALEQWQLLLPNPNFSDRLGEDHLEKLLHVNTDRLVTSPSPREKPDPSCVDGLNMHSHAQFGILADVPVFLRGSNTVIASPGHTARTLGLGLGRAHRQQWAPSKCLHHSMFKTVPSWLLLLQVFPLTGDCS